MKAHIKDSAVADECRTGCRRYNREQVLCIEHCLMNGRPEAMTTPTQTPVVGSIVFSTPTFQRPEDAAAFNALRAALATAQEALRRATTPIANVTLSGDAEYWQERAQRAEADAERWRFFASSKQTALMLGSNIDPFTEEITKEKLIAECNQLADAAIDAAIAREPK